MSSRTYNVYRRQILPNLVLSDLRECQKSFEDVPWELVRDDRGDYAVRFQVGSSYFYFKDSFDFNGSNDLFLRVWGDSFHETLRARALVNNRFRFM